MSRRFVSKNVSERVPDDVQPRHYSQVIWPNEKFLLSDFENNFSENEGTLSSSSWGFDEYEIRSTEKISSSLNAIEDALYDDAETSSTVLSEEMKLECQKWSRAFPHLRIKGKSIATKNGDDAADNSIDLTNRFLESLKQEEEEEIILQDGHCEDSITNEGPNYRNRSERPKEPISAEYIKEKVISQLAAQLWHNTVLEMEKIRWPETLSHEHRLLPPITLEKGSPLKHKSKAKTPRASDIPKLDSILSVSPKVLLPASDKKTVITRNAKSPDQIKLMPSDLVNSKYADKPSQYIQNPGLPLQVKISRVRKSLGQAIEIIPPPLHSIDEISIYNGLKGTSVELENKDVRPRYVPVASPVFMKPPNFLPPIEDREYSPSNVMHGMRNSEYKLLDTMKMLSSNRSSIDEKIANSQNLVNLFPTVTSMELIGRKKNSRMDQYSALNRKKS